MTAVRGKQMTVSEGLASLIPTRSARRRRVMHAVTRLVGSPVTKFVPSRNSITAPIGSNAHARVRTDGGGREPLGVVAYPV